MTTINLRELYPWYTEDAFIEVSDEVAAFLEEDKRLQINYAQYIRDNRAFYSLDAGDDSSKVRVITGSFTVHPLFIIQQSYYKKVKCGKI